jgi:hypothetical protein
LAQTRRFTQKPADFQRGKLISLVAPGISAESSRPAPVRRADDLGPRRELQPIRVENCPHPIRLPSSVSHGADRSGSKRLDCPFSGTRDLHKTASACFCDIILTGWISIAQGSTLLVLPVTRMFYRCSSPPFRTPLTRLESSPNSGLGLLGPT